MGYYYANNYAPARIALRRSSGWEAYVNLGKHGLVYLIAGFLAVFILYLLLAGVVDCIQVFVISLFKKDYSFHFVGLLGKEIKDFGGIKVYMIIAYVFSFLVCNISIGNKNKHLDFKKGALKTTDGVLSIVLEAFDNQNPVKIALKSGKIYVGLVDGEQFERADLDNISIIPYWSGYRDKASLSVEFNCNYMDVYKKYNIRLDDEGRTLRDFRTVIRVSEIETISLFDTKYFGDFEHVVTFNNVNT